VSHVTCQTSSVKRHTSQVHGSGTGDEELLLHVMTAAQAPLWLLSKPWLQQGTWCDAWCVACDRAPQRSTSQPFLFFFPTGVVDWEAASIRHVPSLPSPAIQPISSHVASEPLPPCPPSLLFSYPRALSLVTTQLRRQQQQHHAPCSFTAPPTSTFSCAPPPPRLSPRCLRPFSPAISSTLRCCHCAVFTEHPPIKVPADTRISVPFTP